MEYTLIIPRKVQKDLKNIDSRYRTRILVALASLSKNPFLGKKLDGEYMLQRSYEVWPYRIIYEFRRTELVVLIIRIGHRQGVY